MESTDVVGLPRETGDAGEDAAGSRASGPHDERLRPAPARGEGELVRVWRPEGLAGVEVLHVERSARHWRQFHERYSVLTAVRAGSDVAHRGRVRAVTTGDLLFLEAGEVHVNLRIHTPQTFDALCVDPPTLAAAAAELGARGAAPHWRDLVRRDPETFAALAGLHRALAGAATTLERQTRLAGCLERLLRHHAELSSRESSLPGLRPVEPRAAPSDRPPRHPAVRRARDYLAAHFAEDVTLDALAQAAALSKYHLVRVFAAEVGLPPHAYLTELRVAAARRLIARGRGIADAAYATGFATQAHLHRHFRRAWGVAPGQYARAGRSFASVDPADGPRSGHEA